MGRFGRVQSRTIDLGIAAAAATVRHDPGESPGAAGRAGLRRAGAPYNVNEGGLGAFPAPKKICSGPLWPRLLANPKRCPGTHKLPCK